MEASERQVPDVHAHRRNDYDVTDTVQVSSPDAVCEAVARLFTADYPEGDFAPIRRAFEDFHRLFKGELNGFKGCETIYHDMQHSLDVTLTMARLIAGHDRTCSDDEWLGPINATLGILTALFHDAGYIRADNGDKGHGAEYLTSHVDRGGLILEKYMHDVGLGDIAPFAAKLIGFTNYEGGTPVGDLTMNDPRRDRLGHLLGTADLITQMADRCYLEKCRDRLFPEFVLGGIAFEETESGKIKYNYRTGVDLLKKTPHFHEKVMKDLIQDSFEHAYRYVEPLFDGENPYMAAIAANLEFLHYVIDGERWPLLRRNPPVFTWDSDTLDDTRKLVAKRLRDARRNAG